MVPADVDAPLVERAQRGDLRAFEMLVVKYQRRIERLVARVLRDAHDVEDVAQETFVRAWRALPGFRGESAFYTWLYRIAVNTARKALAERLRDPVQPAPGGSADDVEDGTFPAGLEPSDENTPEAWLASREIVQAVNDAIEGLAEDLRRTIVLREIEGLSYEEIANVMNCPIGTVRSRIFRARDAIAERLRPLVDAPHGRRW